MARRWFAVLLTALLGLAAPAQAQPHQASASFEVSVQLQPAASPAAGGGSGVCGSSRGAMATRVGCAEDSTGGPVRVVTTNRDGRTAHFDVFSGGSSVTTWRIVNYADRDYLEVTLGW